MFTWQREAWLPKLLTQVQVTRQTADASVAGGSKLDATQGATRGQVS